VWWCFGVFGDITLRHLVISDICVSMKKRVLVQVSDVTHARWKRVASDRGMSMSEVARRLLEAWLAKEEK
jgi:Zn-dependent membrane protease YugP